MHAVLRGVDTALCIPFVQGYKCHKSNGVVFCFCDGRVFTSCMDDECKNGFAMNGKTFFLVSRVLENDAVATSDTGDNNGDSSPTGHVCSKQKQQFSIDNPKVKGALSTVHVELIMKLKDRGSCSAGTDGLYGDGDGNPATHSCGDPRTTGCSTRDLARDASKVSWR